MISLLKSKFSLIDEGFYFVERIHVIPSLAITIVRYIFSSLLIYVTIVVFTVVKICSLYQAKDF